MAVAGIGGALSTLVDVTLVVLLVRGLGVPVMGAAFFASSVGAVVCFAVNRQFAFRDPSPVRLEQIVRFALVAVASAGLTALAMQVLAVKLGVAVVPARLAVAVFVFVVWAYPAQRRLVWRGALAA